MSNKSIAVALAALAAGVAVGVLLAPESGADTRKKIMSKGEGLKDRLSSMLEEGEELIADLKQKAQGAMSSTSDAIGSAVNTARDASQAMRTKLKDGADEAKDMAAQVRSTTNGARA